MMASLEPFSNEGAACTRESKSSIARMLTGHSEAEYHKRLRREIEDVYGIPILPKPDKIGVRTQRRQPARSASIGSSSEARLAG